MVYSKGDKFYSSEKGVVKLKLSFEAHQAPYMVLKYSKTKGKYAQCSNEECGETVKLEEKSDE